MTRLLTVFAAVAALVVLVCGISSAAARSGQSANQAKHADSRIVFENNHLCWSRGDWQECGRGEIAVIRPDGTGFRRLTHNKVSESGPTWSQDHHWIAYCRETGPRWAVWVMDANGRHRRNVSRALPPFRSGWDLSPHGGRLVVSAGGGESWHLYLVDVHSGKASRLTNLPGEFGETMPTWSPDGTQIAFRSTSEIWVITLATGQIRQLTFNTLGSGSAYEAWSPDGRRIVFEHGGDSALWIMNADGSNAHSLLYAVGQNPTWSADGRWIVFSPFAQNGIKAIHPDGSGLHWIRKEQRGWIDPLPNG